MPCVIEVAGRAPFRSTVLGELFDVRHAAVGALLTQHAKASIDRRMLDRLTQAASTKTTVGDVHVLAGALAALVRESPHAWYWLRNAGASAPLGTAEVRSTHASGPCWSANAGFDMCRVEGRGLSVQGDARSATSFDTLEGEIEIGKETVAARFGPALELLERWLDGSAADVSCTVWLVEEIATDAAAHGEPWHTFDRERLARRAPPLRQAVTSVLGARLKQQGFRKARAGGDEVSARGRPGGGGEVVWARSMDVGVTYLTFEPSPGSASAFRVILKRHPPVAGTFVTEAMLIADPGGAFPYCGREELEGQLLAAWGVLETAGIDWMTDPRALSADAWAERGLASNVRNVGW
jgi:hypothetical protein